MLPPPEKLFKTPKPVYLAGLQHVFGAKSVHKKDVIPSLPLKPRAEAKTRQIDLRMIGPQSSIFSGSTQDFSVFALWAQKLDFVRTEGPF